MVTLNPSSIVGIASTYARQGLLGLVFILTGAILVGRMARSQMDRFLEYIHTLTRKIGRKIHPMTSAGTIEIPVRYNAIAIAHKSAGTVPMTPKTGKPVVLVVEDNQAQREAVKAMIEDTCTILEADDGRSGYELAMLTRPDLILMDIAVPDGFKTLNAIRNVERVHQTPVIALAPQAMSNGRNNLLDCGFDASISKPINTDQLQFAIHEVISQVG